MQASTDNRASRFPVLEEGIERLFREHPMLCGFTIDQSGELDMDCFPLETASEELCRDVVQQLLELVEGRPDEAAWLFGRTFARVVH